MNASNLILILLVCLFWSFNFTAAANGLQHFSPLLFMVLRFIMLVLVLLPFMRMPARDQVARLVLVSLLIGTLHFTVMLWALARSQDVSSVAIIQQTYIPMAVLLAMVMLGERVGWRTLMAIGIATIGVIVIGGDPLILTQADALLLALLSAFLQALGSVTMRGLKGIGVLSFLAWSSLISLPLLILASMLVEQGQWSVIVSASPMQWGSVAYSAFGASLVGHGLFFYLIQRMPVSEVMPYLLLTPVLAVFFGVTVWGDQPGWRVFSGGLLVLSGILIVNLRSRARYRKAGRATDLG